MNTQHTPGPWAVQPSSNPRNGTAWRDIVSHGTEFSPSYVGEALEQDAALIAAAPDLLAALKEMLGMFGGAEPGDDEAHAVLDRAIAAVTKAGGRV